MQSGKLHGSQPLRQLLIGPASHTAWSRGYRGIYSPCLALGAMTYPYETRQITRLWLSLAITAFPTQDYHLITAIHPD